MAWFSFSSLRVRLILIVLLSLVPAFGLIFYEARKERLLANAAAEEKALGLARTAATEQRRLISEARRFLGQLAQERRWWLMDPTKCSALVADQLKRQPQYLNLGVINLKGDVVCSALPLKAPINVADRAYFRRTVETRDFSIGEYQIGRATGKATLNFGFPESDDRGRLQAVVFAALDLTVIEQVFVKAERDEGSVFLMLDRKGTVLSRYPDLEKPVGKPFQDPSILKAIQAKQDEIKGQATGADGIERLYAFTALRSGGEIAGFIGIGIPLKAAFAEANRNLLNNFVLMGLASVLVLAAAWFGSNLFVLRQVNALVSATKRLGSGDLRARTGLPYGQSELGQLARSFDETAASLQTLTRRNELILTSAGEGIYGVDLEGKTTFVNPAAAKTLGYEPSELVGQAMHALAHHSKPDGTSYPKEECPIYTAFTDGAVHHVDNEVFWRKDGMSIPVEYISAPVQEDGKILGAVVTFKDITERKWSEQERARLLGETERNLERIRALREIDLAITSTLDLRSVLDFLLQKIDVFLPHSSATTIRLFNKESGLLEPVACWNLNEAVWKAEEGKPGRGLANVVFETKSSLVVRNAQADPRTRDREFFMRYGLVSYLGVPLIAKRETLGVLGFYTKEEHQFSREEIEFLSTLAGQASIAIHNAQLYEQAQRNLERIRALHDIDTAISSTLELRHILDILLEKIGLFFPLAAGSTIRLLNRSTGELEPTACRNLNETEWKTATASVPGGVARMLPKDKEPVAVRNAQTDPRSLSPELLRRHGFVSYLRVPMVAKDDLLGMLTVFTKEEHEFTKEEIGFLKTLAGQAAIAIHNAQLYEQTKRQTAELERSNRVKDEFLSVMSHELRTPLSVVMGYTGMVKEGMLGEINPKQEEALQKVLARAGDQLDMINEIMQTTQLEARAMKAQREAFDLHDFLEQLRADYRTRRDEKGVKLVWNYPAGPVQITSDGAMLKQILQNLINNALKFTDEGNIRITARLVEIRDQESGIGAAPQSATPNFQSLTPNSCFVELKVSDTGIGIPKEKLAHLFDKFYQIDSSETRLYGGVGLGLYIVKQFTDLLGGQISVESEVDKGTTFTVRLPCQN